jgi:hypothetical protein
MVGMVDDELDSFSEVRGKIDLVQGGAELLRVLDFFIAWDNHVVDDECSSGLYEARWVMDVNSGRLNEDRSQSGFYHVSFEAPNIIFNIITLNISLDFS